MIPARCDCSRPLSSRLYYYYKGTVPNAGESSTFQASTPPASQKPSKIHPSATPLPPPLQYLSQLLTRFQLPCPEPIYPLPGPVLAWLSGNSIGPRQVLSEKDRPDSDSLFLFLCC